MSNRYSLDDQKNSHGTRADLYFAEDEDNPDYEEFEVDIVDRYGRKFSVNILYEVGHVEVTCFNYPDGDSQPIPGSINFHIED